MGMEQFEEIQIPEIEEKKSGKWKVGVGIVAACVVLFVIVAGFIFMKLYNSEDKALVKGILNLAGEVEDRKALWEEVSGNRSDDLFGAVKMTTVFNVSSEELPVTLGVDTIVLRDAGERRVQASTEVSVMNNELVGMTIDGDEDTLTVALPVFFRQNLAFDTERIDRQYNGSLLAEKFGRLEGMELSVELFPEGQSGVWNKYYVNLMDRLKEIETEGFGEIEIEKPEEPLVLNVPEKDNRQYQCSQYRIVIPYHENELADSGNGADRGELADGGNGADSMVLLIAVDENDRIVQIVTEEPVVVSMEYKGSDIDVKLTENICFLGEEKSIDDMVVNMQVEIPLEVLELPDDLLSVFGNKPEDEKDMIEIQAVAEITYDENDSSVTTALNKLTVKVDRIGSFKVTGTMVMEPLHEEIKALEGETIRIFEITETQYQDLELQFLLRIGRWLKAIEKLWG